MIDRKPLRQRILTQFYANIFCGIKLYIHCQIISKQEDQTHDVRQQCNGRFLYITKGQ